MIYFIFYAVWFKFIINKNNFKLIVLQCLIRMKVFSSYLKWIHIVLIEHLKYNYGSFKILLTINLKLRILLYLNFI